MNSSRPKNLTRKTHAKPGQRTDAGPTFASAVTAPALEHLSEVASQRVLDHHQRFKKDYSAGRQSVAFLSKVVENEDTAPIDLLISANSPRRNVKTQATQELIRIRDENAELILAAQQNAEKLNEIKNADGSRVESTQACEMSFRAPSSAGTGLCATWRRTVYHFNTLALMAAQQSAQLRRREEEVISSRELAQRVAKVMDENRILVDECATLEKELAQLERDGEWLDVQVPRWRSEESFLDSLPRGELDWKKLMFTMQRFVKETRVPQRELDAVDDILDAVYQMTSGQVLSKLPR